MIREQITHQDLDGNTVTSVLHFNLNRVEVGENLHLLPRFEKFQKIFNEPERGLSTDEVQELLELIKLIMKLSYGIRSDDGQRFIKGENVWLEFTQTAAYDAFLFSLFEDPTRADRWMTGLLPQGLMEQAANLPANTRPPTQDRLQKQERPVQVVHLPDPPAEELPQPATDESQPAVPTPDELEKFRAWQEQQNS